MKTTTTTIDQGGQIFVCTCIPADRKRTATRIWTHTLLVRSDLQRVGSETAFIINISCNHAHSYLSACVSFTLKRLMTELILLQTHWPKWTNWLIVSSTIAKKKKIRMSQTALECIKDLDVTCWPSHIIRATTHCCHCLGHLNSLWYHMVSPWH